jgi:sulfotransferase 6B1
MWNNLLTKSAMARRLYGVYLRYPQLLARRGATVTDFQNNPPVIVNSIPKSGTHLLSQIVAVLPHKTNYGDFWTCIPSYSYKQYSKKTMLKKIQSLAPGELTLAHLFYDPLYAEALQAKQSLHFFIYRDPRDIAISEAHYLTYINRWHRLHPIYKKTSSPEKRITLALEGLTHNKSLVYPNVAERCKDYLDWLGKPGVCAIKFEDLVSEGQEKALRQIFTFYAERVNLDCDVEQLIKAARLNINPSQSPTFKDGKVGSWKRLFTPAQVELTKHIAGDLLVQLNYEQDLDW